MAPILGYLQVTFTPNFIGEHRVCWRIQGSGDPYVCQTVDCDTDPCTAYLDPATFENESCDEVTYEGYIQASCEDPDTLDGAVFWTEVFTPNPQCQPYTLTCIGVSNSGGITLDLNASGYINFIPRTTSSAVECYCAQPVTINDDILAPPLGLTDTTLITPGSLYCGMWNGEERALPCGGSRGYNACDPLDNPAILGPPCDSNNPCYPFFCACLYKPIINIGPPPVGGIQATAEVILGYGGLTLPNSLTILSGGTGTPNLNFTYTGVWNTNLTYAIPGAPQGYGKQKFDVTVQNGVVIQVIPLNNPPGYYFGVNEQFSFSPADIGGVTGVICQVNPFGTNFGLITGVIITNPGSGYVIPPPVTLSIAPCSVSIGAEINPVISVEEVLGPCPSFFPGEGCSPFVDPTPPIIPSLPIGSTFNLCYPTRSIPPSITIPDSYEITLPEDACCYACRHITVLAGNDPNPTISYIDCDLQNVVVFTMTSLSLSLSCVVEDSWVSTDPTTQFIDAGLCIS